MWTTVLDHYERHCLWFHLFDTLDRVRLWNSLVFSDGYFRLLSNSSKYERKDLSRYFRENITLKVRRDEDNLKEKKEQDLKKQEKLGDGGIFNKGNGEMPDLKDTKLTAEEQRVIRDRHYTPKVMLKMWNMIKQRQYEVEDNRNEPNENPKKNAQSESNNRNDASGDEEHGKEGAGDHGHTDEDAGQQTKTKTMEMPKKEFIEMIRSLFKIMIHGVSHDRLFVLMQEAWNRGALSLNRKLKRR